MPKDVSFLRRLLQSRIFLGILLIATVYSGFRLANEVARRGKINAEITRLKAEISELQSQQEGLQNLISYLNTDTYIEEQARKQLNLIKPGEKVVVINEEKPAATSLDDNRGAIALWWDYFFKIDEQNS